MYHFVYILTTKYNKRFYTGYTNNLVRRTYEHKNHLDKGSFTYKYNITKLIYYEVFEDYEYAREREDQIKYKCQYKNVHFWPNKHVQFTHS